MRLPVSAFCTGLALSLFLWSPGKAQIIDSSPLVVFSANDGDHGAELWVTNGTAAGTRLLMDIVPGSSSSFPFGMTATEDGRAFFSATSAGVGRELWVTDGTREGTHMVKDIFVGTSGSAISGLTYVGSGRVAFAANDDNAGSEPWISDGTEAGTFRLVNAEPGPQSGFPVSFARLDDKLFMFTASRNGQRRIWISDGTVDGTRMMPGPLRDGYDFSLMDDGRVLFAAGHPTRGGQAGSTILKQALDQPCLRTSIGMKVPGHTVSSVWKTGLLSLAQTTPTVDISPLSRMAHGWARQCCAR